MRKDKCKKCDEFRDFSVIKNKRIAKHQDYEQLLWLGFNSQVPTRTLENATPNTNELRYDNQ